MDAHIRSRGHGRQLSCWPDRHVSDLRQVEDAAVTFWDEIATESETKAKVVQIFKDYNDVMNKAGKPYRY